MKRKTLEAKYIANSIKNPSWLIMIMIGIGVIISGLILNLICIHPVDYSKTYDPKDVANAISLGIGINLIMFFGMFIVLICVFGCVAEGDINLNKKEKEDYKEYLVSKNLEKDFKQYLLDHNLAYDEELDEWRSEFPEYKIPFEREVPVLK